MTKLARQANSRLSQRKRGFAPAQLQLQWARLFANTSMINVGLLSVFISLGTAYLGVVNSAAADTFHVSDLQAQVDTLKKEQRDTQLVLTEAQSLQHVKSMSADFQLVAGGEVQYADGSTAVALSQ